MPMFTCTIEIGDLDVETPFEAAQVALWVLTRRELDPVQIEVQDQDGNSCGVFSIANDEGDSNQLSGPTIHELDAADRELLAEYSRVDKSSGEAFADENCIRLVGNWRAIVQREIARHKAANPCPTCGTIMESDASGLIDTCPKCKAEFA